MIVKTNSAYPKEYAARRDLKNAQGLCENCSRLRDGEFKRCRLCLDATLRIVNQVHREKRKTGICWDCPLPIDGSRGLRCPNCADRNIERNQIAKARRGMRAEAI